MRFISKAKTKKKIVRRKKPAVMEIGWREWAAFPDFEIDRIKAKIDTGAKTCALHAYAVREFVRNGAPYAEFYVHPIQRKRAPAIRCRALIVDKRRIKSSNGLSQERLIIQTTLKLGQRSWPIEVSLTSRDEMGFRFLIGRDALRKRVVVHPGKSFLLGK